MKRGVGFILAVALWLVAATAAQADNPFDADDKGLFAPPGSTPAITDDHIQRLAATDGVSLAHAERVLEAQLRAGDIAGDLRALLDDKFAGIWLDRTEARFKIGVADPDSVEKIAAYLDNNDIGDIAEIANVRSTFAELEVVQQRWIEDHKHELGKPGLNIAIDSKRNAVFARVRDDLPQATLASLAQEAEATIANGPRIVVEQVPAERFTSVRPTACNNSIKACDVPWRGGTGIFHDSARLNPGLCTSGFVTQGNGPNGYLFLLTAGHCLRGHSNGSQWDQRQANGQVRRVGYQHNWVDQNYDAGIIRFNSPYFQQWYLGTVVWNRTDFYPLYGVWWPVQGAWLCRTGITTATVCGVNNQVNITVDLPNGLGQIHPHHGYVENASCTHGGDSGGPWLYLNLAAGIHTHGADCPYPLAYYQIFQTAASVMNVHLQHY